MILWEVLQWESGGKGLKKGGGEGRSVRHGRRVEEKKGDEEGREGGGDIVRS